MRGGGGGGGCGEARGKNLPWFWKVKTNPLLPSISLCKYFG